MKEILKTFSVFFNLESICFWMKKRRKKVSRIAAGPGVGGGDLFLKTTLFTYSFKTLSGYSFFVLK